MKYFCLVLLLILSTHGLAQTQDDAILREIDFIQNLGDQVPANTMFTDSSGKEVSLGNLWKDRPTILVLGYYDCPMLCSMVHNGIIEALNGTELKAGKDFELVSISIDPAETADLAAEQKKNYLLRYKEGKSPDGFHFLTGQIQAIQSVAQAVGFKYVYDESNGEYAHASGFVVLTPEGKISRYFFGVDYEPSELQKAIQTAGKKEVGSPIQALILKCFHYDPTTGKYGALITWALRVGAILTIVGLALLVWRWSAKPRRRTVKVVEVKG